MKVEAQIAKKNAFKNSPNDGYYNNSWKNKKSFSNLPYKDSSFTPKKSLSLLLLLIFHPSNRLVRNVLNVWVMVT